MEEKTMHFKKGLHEAFKEEIETCNDYLTLAHQAEEHGHHEMARGIYHIAQEEHEHATFYRHALYRMGVEIPSEDLMKFHELNERMEAVFR